MGSLTHAERFHRGFPRNSSFSCFAPATVCRGRGAVSRTGMAPLGAVDRIAALLRHGYLFIPKLRERRGTDVSETRVMGQRATEGGTAGR